MWKKRFKSRLKLALTAGLAWVLFLFGSGRSQSQVPNSTDRLILFEDSLKRLFDTLRTLPSQDDSSKTRICQLISDSWVEALHQPGSFDYPFQKITGCGKLFSEDGRFRLFNWNRVDDDGTFQYYGILQIKKNNGQQVIHVLQDTRDPDPGIENLVLDADQWPGCLYYQIIPVKDGGTTYYTLLGWDGNNNLTNRKIIEVLRISSLGKPKFGAGIIQWGKSRKKRVVFEFAEKANMALSFDTRLNQLVFDHLSPSNPVYEGNFAFYGPDFSNDALEFKKGRWERVEGVDARNPQKKGSEKMPRTGQHD